MKLSVRGFTLLELMVALMVLSLLSGLVFGGFRLASRAWETVNTHSALTSERMQAHYVLRNLLEQAEQVDLWDTAENYLPSFQGTERELFFLASLPIQLRPSSAGAQYAWFYLALDETDPDHPLLQLKAQPFIQDEENLSLEWDQLKANFQTPGRVSPLLELSVDSLTLSYQARERDNSPDWQSQWLDEEGLPELIQIKMGNSLEQSGWPPLVITPRKNRYDIKATF